MRNIRKYPLLFLLLATAAIFTLIGIMGGDTLYASYSAQGSPVPSLARVFQGIHDGIYPWEILHSNITTEDTSSDSPQAQSSPGNDTVPPSGNLSSEHTQEDLSSAGSSTDDNFQQEEEVQQEVLPRSFTQVDESYFEDALFIGDSRTVGMMEYGGFSDNTVFFAKTSLSIYDLFYEPVSLTMADGTSKTLEELLCERSFGKIYIMLGINELGRGTTESFSEEYRSVLERIRELAPDSVLFLQAIMRVGQEKDASDPIFNNTNIQARNEALSQLADSHAIFWLDPNEVVCSPEGYLIPDYTSDQVHLKAQYYQLWKDYLMTRGIT